VTFELAPSPIGVSTIVVGQSQYSVGKKYCRRYECYFITPKAFSECCGMQLRNSPSEREYKEKMELFTQILYRM